MLRSGATLDMVGAELRHRSPGMTAHYAKVDIFMLQQIAHPGRMVRDVEPESCQIRGPAALAWLRVPHAQRLRRICRGAWRQAYKSARVSPEQRFALAMHAEDGRHEIPAANAIGHANIRRRTTRTRSLD